MPEGTFSASYDATTKAVFAVVCLILSARVHAFRTGHRRQAADREHSGTADLREIRAGNPDDFTGCVRLWGSGGLFGYYGLFWTARRACSVATRMPRESWPACLSTPPRSSDAGLLAGIDEDHNPAGKVGDHNVRPSRRGRLPVQVHRHNVAGIRTRADIVGRRKGAVTVAQKDPQRSRFHQADIRNAVPV